MVGAFCVFTHSTPEKKMYNYDEIKVGDNVKIVDDRTHWWNFFEIGEIVTITEVHDDGSFDARRYNDFEGRLDFKQRLHRDHFVKCHRTAKVAAGDKVRIVKSKNELGHHFAIGEVVTIVDPDYAFYGVSAFNGEYDQSMTFDDFEVVTDSDDKPTEAPLPALSGKSQNALIIQHLAAGKTLTRITADHLYRVASLTRRIRDLRDAGYPIVSTWKKDLTGRPYVEYSLKTMKKVG